MTTRIHRLSGMGKDHEFGKKKYCKLLIIKKIELDNPGIKKRKLQKILDLHNLNIVNSAPSMLRLNLVHEIFLD